MGKEEEKQDELVTRAAALVISWLKHNLKNEIRSAIKELREEFWNKLVSDILHNNWVRLLAGLLFLLSAIGFWLKDKV